MTNLLFSPKGRLPRNAFWRGIILCLALAMVVRVLEAFVATPFGLIALLLIWPYFCLYAKRFHDAGQGAGWFALIVLGYAVITSIIGNLLAPLVAPEFVTLQQELAEKMFASDLTPEHMEAMTALAQRATQEGILVTLLSLVGANALLGFLVGRMPSDPNTNRHGPPTIGISAKTFS